MKNEITIFENELFGAVRTLYIENAPWFVGKDVAKALGYEKPLNAIAMHVDEDDSLKQGLIDSMGRIQETIIINEAGVYSLIFSSKLPTAKAFKKWVTHDVLPSIRKHGVYLADDVLEKISKDPEYLLEIADNLRDEKRMHEIGCSYNLRVQLADYGKKLKCRKLIDILEQSGWIHITKATKHESSSLIPCDEYIENGYFAPFELKDKNGFIGTGFALTEKGKEAIAQLINS